MDDIKISSNRSFGIVFFVVFFLISVFPLLNGENIRIWSLLISIIFSWTSSNKKAGKRKIKPNVQTTCISESKDILILLFFKNAE